MFIQCYVDWVLNLEYLFNSIKFFGGVFLLLKPDLLVILVHQELQLFFWL